MKSQVFNLKPHNIVLVLNQDFVDPDMGETFKKGERFKVLEQHVWVQQEDPRIVPMPQMLMVLKPLDNDSPDEIFVDMIDDLKNFSRQER